MLRGINDVVDANYAARAFAIVSQYSDDSRCTLASGFRSSLLTVLTRKLLQCVKSFKSDRPSKIDDSSILDSNQVSFAAKTRTLLQRQDQIYVGMCSTSSMASKQV